MTPSPKQSEIDTALRNFITAIVPGIEVVRGQDNRVPQPKGADHVVFWPIRRPRLATNIDTYDTDSQTETVLTETEIVMQLDVHGPNASDNAQAIRALFRDEYGVTNVEGSNAAVTPLYCDDPRQVPFQNAEQQVEYRWVVEAHLQANQALSVFQDNALALKVQTASIDTIPTNLPPPGKWEAHTTPKRVWVDIAFSPPLGLFAAVAQSLTGTDIMTSPDGKVWTLRNTPVFASGNWLGIAWCQAFNLFVAVGIRTDFGNTLIIMTSPDGLAWTAVPNLPAGAGVAYTIAGSDTGACAIGFSGAGGPATFTTTDGLNWTLNNIPVFFNSSFTQISWSSELQRFCALAPSPSFVQPVAIGLPDGVTWTLQNAPQNSWINSTAGRGLFCAVGSGTSGADAMTSPANGVWTPRPTPSSLGQTWQDVAFGNEVFLAISGSGSGFDAMRSPDGSIWSPEQTPGNGWVAICYAPPPLGIFCAISSSQTGKDAMITA